MEVSNESSSQQAQQNVDVGEDSYSVDITPVESLKEEKEILQEEKEVTTPEVVPLDDEKRDDTPAEEEKKTVTDTDSVPKGVKKRLDKMRVLQGDAERRAEAVELKNQALEQEIKMYKMLDIGKKPDIDDFESEEEFSDAMIDYKVNLRFAEQEKKQLEEIQGQANEKAEEIVRDRQEVIQASFNEAAEKYKDFNATVQDVKVSNTVIDILGSLENPGDVAYQIAKDPELNNRLSSLSVIEAAIEMQKISEAVKPNITSNAPAPITPISTKKGAIKTLEEMSMSEYIAHRKKQGN